MVAGIVVGEVVKCGPEDDKLNFAVVVNELIIIFDEVSVVRSADVEIKDCELLVIVIEFG